MKTAVSNLTRLLPVILLPLLSLVWVTQLLAQAAPPLPDFIITPPVLSDVAGADIFQIRFVGLNRDAEGAFLPVDRINVEPSDKEAGIFVISSPIRPLTDTPFYITLLVDTSGSMAYSLERVKNQLRHVIQNAPETAYFSLVGFNGQIRADQFVAFTNNPEVLKEQINRLKSEDGSTCLDDVAYTAVQSLTQLPQDTRRAIILFTDGVDEVTRGRPERCSQQFQYEDAVDLAATQTISIPLHTVIYPYSNGDDLILGKPLPSQNNLLTGLSIAPNIFPQSFITITNSFTQQWEATIELYTPSGVHTLNLIPYLPDSTMLETQPLTYSTQFDHFPAALAEDLSIGSVIYDEETNQFDIQFTLCASGNLYCNPARTSEIELLIENVFTRKLTRRTFSPDQFALTNEPQTITIPIRLQPEHYYLMRVTAKNGITPANYHPFGEAIFVYRPRLDIQVTQAKLDRFALQPDLIVSLFATRTVSTEPITAVAELQINNRSLFTQTTPVQPSAITVNGYLLYTGKDSQNELYPLPTQYTTTQNLNAVPITLTFPAAAGGGYADYKPLLTITDRQDGFATQYELDKLQPSTWWGEQLRLVRQILANPLIFAAAILLFLLLLGLIWLAMWTARRMIQPEKTAVSKTPAAETPPAHLYVDATPDDAVRHQTYTLPKDKSLTFLIGTRRECDLTMQDDQLMAEEHAKVVCLNGGYGLINCDPDYSTFINQNEIISGEAIPIRNGDKIRLGALTRLTLHHPKSDNNGNGHGSDG